MTFRAERFHWGDDVEFDWHPPRDVKRLWDESKHPRDPGGEGGGQFIEAGGGDGGGDTARVTLPVGLGVPDGSPLAKAGISVVKHADAEKVVRSIASSVGSKVTSAQHSFGGWTDPSDNTYYPEPTLVAEFSGKQDATRLVADAIAHVLGPQKEVWIVNDGEKLPSARDLRLDIMPTKAGVTAEQLSDIARKVDPQLFSGFTQTTDANGRVGITVLVKDGIAPWRSAPSSAVVSGFGKPFEVQINPTERDVRSMIKDAQDSGSEEVRVILDRDQNLYVWDASNAIHASIETSLNLDAEERDLWMLEKGKLKGVMFDGSHGRPLPKDIIAGVASVPTSSAAISVRADQGLLRLVSALDTAGIDAEVLPTAVLIDKRVANGEAGYRAPIEQQAGVEAVIALDGYRTRLAAALKAGKAPPPFDIDLAKLAAEHQQVRRKAFDWDEPHGDMKAFEWIWSEPYGDVKSFELKDWDESKHPRDPGGEGGGQFIEAGGGGGGGETFAVPSPQNAEAQARASIAVGAAQATAQGVKPLQGSSGHPRLISNRAVTATGPRKNKPIPENSEEKYLPIDLAAMKTDPVNYAHDINLFRDASFYPGLTKAEGKGDDDAVAQAVIARTKENLKFLYDNTPKEIRDRSKLWYVGARRLTDRRVKQYGYSDAQVSGVYAALSPQKDWFQNVYLGDAVLKIYSTKQDHRWDDKMTATAARIWKPKHEEVIKKIRGKTLGELTSAEHKAYWIRTYDEAHSDREFHIITPEGEYDGLQRNQPKKNEKVGRPSKAAWSPADQIKNAITALESGGDRETISGAMGKKHKVRSFYNNFLDPFSANGDVTIDTHAVGAAWLMPHSGDSVAVIHSLKSTLKAADKPVGFDGSSGSAFTGVQGTYAIYAEAYRRLAGELGIQPRELQSITWEAQRGLFGEDWKTEEHKDGVNAIWQRFNSGELSLEQARDEIVKYAGGFKPPDWWGK